MGGIRRGNSWTWVDHSPWAFTSWACCCGACMPDNAGGNQVRVSIQSSVSSVTNQVFLVMNFEPWKFGIGKWDDAFENHNLDGYFCEMKI